MSTFFATVNKLNDLWRLRPSKCIIGLLSSAILISCICAGCSNGASPASSNDASKSVVMPPTDQMQAVVNSSPPPLNIPANVPEATREKMIAQEQADNARNSSMQAMMFEVAKQKGAHQATN